MSPVVQYNLDSIDSVNTINKLLDKHKFPRKLGLTENNIFIRYNKNESFNKVFEDIYYLIHHHIKRDQLVFMFCLWKHNQLGHLLIMNNEEKKQMYEHQHIGAHYI